MKTNVNCRHCGIRRYGAEHGATLTEVAIGLGILLVVLSSIFMATMGAQGAFLENEVISRIHLRAQIALERIIEVVGQASTLDADFTPLRPTSGLSSHCLRFRLVEYYDDYLGEPIFNSSAKVYIYGPDAGSEPNAGLIIGRGGTLGEIYGNGKGADGLLGTTDDDLKIKTSSGQPIVELLIPSTFAPQTGTMFTVDVSPAPIGRLLTFTLRLNFRNPDGQFVLPNDLVLTERLALRR